MIQLTYSLRSKDYHQHSLLHQHQQLSLSSSSSTHIAHSVALPPLFSSLCYQRIFDFTKIHSYLVLLKAPSMSKKQLILSLLYLLLILKFNSPNIVVHILWISPTGRHIDVYAINNVYNSLIP